MAKMEEGYVMADNRNLPSIDSISVTNFFANNKDYRSNEMRCVKAQRSGSEGYGDDAVGYVQLKRDGPLCTVKCKITPEHRVKSSPYIVTCVWNEVNETVDLLQCEGCTASAGGCKHAIAFLFWLHRRSEEPSATERQCYWSKSKLSRVGASSTSATVSATLARKERMKIKARDVIPEGQLLAQILLQPPTSSHDEMPTLFRYLYHWQEAEEYMRLDMLLDIFTKQTTHGTPEQFLQYCTGVMQQTDCDAVKLKTVKQSESPMWHNYRYGRITASKVYEVANCKSAQGTTALAIIGAARIRDTKEMARGRLLEPLVRNRVSEMIRCNIEPSGIVLCPDEPIFGASPDGLTSTHVIEIKCPASEKATKRYISQNGCIAAKYRGQLQLLMHFCNKSKALFSVADPKFEQNHLVTIVEEGYDIQYVTNIIAKSKDYWCKYVFPLLCKGYSA